jgi:hypothetical protein
MRRKLSANFAFCFSFSNFQIHFAYVQSQMDDKDRTIRIQQTMINKLEAEIDKTPDLSTAATATISSIETTTAATQTDRVSLVER